jgi:pimeloyl-ACP methyl ester carboxylesterase
MKKLWFEIEICCVVLTLGLAAAFPQVAAAQAPELPSSVGVTSCTGLTAVQIENTTISSAKEVPDRTIIGPFGPQPEHCLVEGEINKRTGTDGVEYGDRFELRLPKAWNGRFLFQGGGGLDGMLNPAVGAMGPPGTAAKSALARGYAVVSTDGGHQGKNPGDASFGVDPDARTDYQYRSTDLVAGVAKKIVAQYYGRAPEYSYMVGCSNGGREAMIAAQRYPADFDGVVAGDPAFNLTKAAIAEAWFTVKFAEISPKDSTGKPLLHEALTEPELNLLASAVLKACDTLDGLADGMIDNPEACHFSPVVLQCKVEKNDSCLSQAQVRAIQTTFAGPKNTAGESLYSDWPYDAGIGAPGWRSWILGTAQMPAINVLIYPQFVNGIAFLPGERPLSGPFAFNFDTEPPRINKSADLINAVSTKLAPFRDRGGKIIFYTGMSDPVFSANDLIRYYRRLADDNGGMEAVRSSARLFRIPGMNHCFGGPALDNFDTLTAIQEWVEKGNAPESIVATGKAFPGRSRPLCAYPDAPHYQGSGSTDDGRNFICQGPALGGREPGH